MFLSISSSVIDSSPPNGGTAFGSGLFSVFLNMIRRIAPRLIKECAERVGTEPTERIVKNNGRGRWKVIIRNMRPSCLPLRY